MGKLDKYANFMNMPWKEKLLKVKNAKMTTGNTEIPIVRKKFEEENFISLTTFDTHKS
jgi:hypothetical protein